MVKVTTKAPFSVITLTAESCQLTAVQVQTYWDENTFLWEQVEMEWKVCRNG